LARTFILILCLATKFSEQDNFFFDFWLKDNR